MRFKRNKKKTIWKCSCRFAFIPILIKDEWVWLERFYIVKRWVLDTVHENHSWVYWDTLTREEYLERLDEFR